MMSFPANGPNDDYFSGNMNCCPFCSVDDEFLILNIERAHIACCTKHMIRWDIGSNLFSSWRNETEEVWTENAKLLVQCDEVEP